MSESSGPNPAPVPGQDTPEAAATNRIKELQEKLKTAQQHLHTIRGRMANRDPNEIEKIKAHNAELLSRKSLLHKALFSLLQESLRPGLADDQKTQYEALRQSALDYFKNAKIDEAQWKNIVS